MRPATEPRVALGAGHPEVSHAFSVQSAEGTQHVPPSITRGSQSSNTGSLVVVQLRTDRQVLPTFCSWSTTQFVDDRALGSGTAAIWSSGVHSASRRCGAHSGASSGLRRDGTPHYAE